MMDHYISLVLVGLLIFQQVYYTLMINRLVNKLMSRNYHEYVQADNIPNRQASLKVKVEDEHFEDMGQLAEFGPNF